MAKSTPESVVNVKSPENLFARLVTLHNTVQATREKLARINGDWEIARQTVKEREEGYNKAEADAIEKYAEELPAKEWKRLQALNHDRVNAREKFELVAREKRRNERFIKEQVEAHWDLCNQFFGEPGSLDFASAAAKVKGNAPAWHSVQVRDLVGPNTAKLYEPHGLITLKQAKDAFEGEHAKQLTRDGHLSKEAYDWLKSQVIQELERRDIKHELGKANNKAKMPDAPAKVEEPKPETEDFNTLVVSNVQRDEIREATFDWSGADTGYMTNVAPVPHGPDGSLVFQHLKQVDQVAVVATKADFMLRYGERALRLEPDERKPDAWLGVEIIGPSDYVWVITRVMNLKVTQEAKPKAEPTAPKPPKRVKKGHPKSKKDRDAVRRKAEQDVDADTADK